MALIADVLLIAGALGAGFYCWILGRRLTRFTSLEQGVGNAITSMSAQVKELSDALATAQQSAQSSVQQLDDVSQRADDATQKLELLLASMHDLPDTPAPRAENPFFVREAPAPEARS